MKNYIYINIRSINRRFCLEERNAKGEVGLWDLLTLLSGASAIGTAYGAVEGSKIENFDFFIALIVGVIVGVSCIFIIRMFGSWAFKLMPPDIEPHDDLKWWMKLIPSLVGASAFIWPIISGFLGYYVTKFFIDAFLL